MTQQGIGRVVVSRRRAAMVLAVVLADLATVQPARADLSSVASWSTAESDETYSVAWGDYDSDGDPDLAVGNFAGQPNRVYRNDSGNLVVAWTSTETGDTTSVAWGDYDRDGDLDLAAGNRLYRNDGATFTGARHRFELRCAASRGGGRFLELTGHRSALPEVLESTT